MDRNTRRQYNKRPPDRLTGKTVLPPSLRQIRPGPILRGYIIRIALDIEGTLAATAEAYISDYNQEHGTSYTVENHITSWDLVNDPFDLKEFLQRISRIWQNHEQIQPTEPNIPKKLANIAQLNHVHIDLVTSRRDRKAEMQEWLKGHGIHQGKHYNQLLTAKNKETLDYNLYIDDNPEMNIPQLLYDQPWNQVEETQLQTRIFNLEEAHQHIKNAI